MKKNLVSIFVMEYKDFKVAFVGRKVRIWRKIPKDAFTLGFRVEGLNQVGGAPLGALNRNASLQSELWHQRFAHLHYKALLGLRKMVKGMPEFNMKHEGVCQGCAVGKHTKGAFPSSESYTTNIFQFPF